MKYKLIISFLLFSFASCNNAMKASKNSEKDVAEETSTAEKSPTLQAFTTLTDLIDGCSCLISENSTAFRAGEFLYADNLQDTGFVKIDGKMLKLSLDESNNSSEMELYTTGSNGEVEVTLDLRKSDQMDYVGAYFGTLEIKLKNGKKIKKTVFGECGC